MEDIERRRLSESQISPQLSSATAASPVFRSFPIYTDKGTRKGHYIASGYMGDSDLALSGAYIPTQDGQGPAIKVDYSAKGPKGWSGLYWQDPANNWGGVPGKAGYDLRGATRLTFWARGERGGERVQEFRIGGITGGKYPDSDIAALKNVRLSKEWKQYAIDLTGKDLRHIIGGFGFLMNKKQNAGGSVFFLNDIYYQGPAGVTPPEPAPVITSVVTSTPSAMEFSTASLKGEDLKVQVEETGLKVSFSKRLHFMPGKALLGQGSDRVLDQLIDLLNAYPDNNVLVEGHTDSTGSASFNLELSRLRSASVRDYLIRKGGFDLKRFRVVGYGPTKPVADNKTAVGRSLNRRVEVTILKKAE